MKKKIIAVVFVAFFMATGIVNAGELENIYADMDSKVMASNMNVLNYYSPDAVIIGADGKILQVNELRNIMVNSIRAGVKIDIHQSRILGTRELRTGFTQKLMGIVVFSEDYTKSSVPWPSNPSKRKTIELTEITTRVFNTVAQKPWGIIISEQNTIVSGK